MAQDAPPAATGIKVLPLRVTGPKLSAEEIRSLTNTLVAKLKRYPTLQVMTAPEQDAMDMVVDAGCTELDAACLALIGKAAGAEKVVLVEVAEKDDRQQVNLRYVNTASREALVPEPGMTTRNKLAETVAVSVEKVLGFEPEVPAMPVQVDITTTPAGADIYVGKGFIGQTPVSIKLKPDTYTIRVNKNGFKEELLTLPVKGTEPITKAITLVKPGEPSAVPPPPAGSATVSKTPWYKTWWFWTAVGGAVVVAGTTAFLVTSQGGGSGGPGSAGFAVNPALAPNDVTIFRTR